MAAKSVGPAELTLLRLLVAQQLVAGHGRQWDGLGARLQADYLTDAEAVVDQGLASYWQDPGEPPDSLSPAMEAEVFAFDQGVQWFLQYYEARHGLPADFVGSVPVQDVEDWDAWLTVWVTASALVRRAWARRLADDSAEGAPNCGDLALYAPDCGDARQGRAIFTRAIGATLAFRHGHRWMDLSNDLRDMYLRDASGLIDAGLSDWR